MGFEPTTSALGSSLGRSENGAQTTDRGGRYTPRGQFATANFLRRKHVSYGCFLASRLYLLRVLCKDALRVLPRTDRRQIQQLHRNFSSTSTAHEFESRFGEQKGFARFRNGRGGAGGYSDRKLHD